MSSTLPAAASSTIAAIASASGTAAASAAASSYAAAAADGDGSLYGMIPSFGGNLAFTVLFAFLGLIHVLLAIWYKQRWIGVAFFFGLLLEAIGYGSRAVAHDSPDNKDHFLAQIICLTIAPCFVMGGYYYLLAKMVVIYGERYSILAPIFYSYIFITCDIISLVLQGAGGGIAAVALNDDKGTTGGTHIMIAGLAFQVFTMSVFLFFWIHYFYNIYFGSNRGFGNEPRTKPEGTKFFNTLYKDDVFDPGYAHVRQRRLFNYFPMVVLVGTLAIYTRCIYRVIELAQGWEGFLITHEDYVFVLDGMMLLIAVAVLVPPFYPGFIFGRNNAIVVPKSLKAKKRDHTQVNTTTTAAADPAANDNSAQESTGLESTTAQEKDNQESTSDEIQK